MTRAAVEKPEGACAYGTCLKKAIEGGRCGRHHRFVACTIVRYGGESREKVQRVPFTCGPETPRDVLVDSLAAVLGDDEHALSVVDALDAYLETDPVSRSPGLQYAPHNDRVALSEANKELEELRSKLEVVGSRLSQPPWLGSAQPTQGVEPLAEAAVASAANGLKFEIRAAYLLGVRRVLRMVRKVIHDLDDYLTD